PGPAGRSPGLPRRPRWRRPDRPAPRWRPGRWRRPPGPRRPRRRRRLNSRPPRRARPPPGSPTSVAYEGESTSHYLRRMAGGLVGLFDDVAALAKLAAASVDDVGAAAGRASVKAAGVVVDDTAVTPGYVQGLAAERELPIIRRIALGS